ncbi:MAG: DUF4390 domain-containing protein [Deltaproteobacteria bacterium]|nr:DUF4390 domain-containing protein [Deltaproteobacteria bacterium]
MKRPICLFITVILLALPVFCFAAADARINNVRVAPVNGSGAVSVSFSVSDAFTKEIDDAIKSGLATSFTFRVEVERKNTLWFDHNEADVRFRHTVKYDTLRDEYNLTLDEAANTVERTKDAVSMKELMSVCNGVVLRPQAGFVKGENYEIRIKAELHTIKLPMGLDYVLFFVKLWDFETDWHTVIFSP